jgi:hypothetical protein
MVRMPVTARSGDNWLEAYLRFLRVDAQFRSAGVLLLDQYWIQDKLKHINYADGFFYIYTVHLQY